MPDEPTRKPARRRRADGERNRARLVEAARHAFGEHGSAVSLERIARDAGVSIATLYRHFPTRDALVEAVYRQETDSLVEAATRLTEERDPVSALREWLLLFVDFLATKQGMSDVLGTLLGGPDALYDESSVRLGSAVDALVGRAAATGALRADVEPLDLLRAIGGVANVNPAKQWRQSAARMVDLLLTGAVVPTGGQSDELTVPR